jgi:hypothetical protein
MAEVVEHLSSKHEALTLAPSTAKKKITTIEVKKLIVENLIS